MKLGMSLDGMDDVTFGDFQTIKGSSKDSNLKSILFLSFTLLECILTNT